jgi:hypothetical protein
MKRLVKLLILAALVVGVSSWFSLLRFNFHGPTWDQFG